MAHTICLLDFQGYVHVWAFTRPRGPGTLMHARPRMHTQTNNKTYFFSTSTMIREPVSVLRYMYIAPLVVTYAVFAACAVRTVSLHTVRLILVFKWLRKVLRPLFQNEIYLRRSKTNQIKTM